MVSPAGWSHAPPGMGQWDEFCPAHGECGFGQCLLLVDHRWRCRGWLPQRPVADLAAAERIDGDILPELLAAVRVHEFPGHGVCAHLNRRTRPGELHARGLYKYLVEGGQSQWSVWALDPVRCESRGARHCCGNPDLGGVPGIRVGQHS